MFAAALRVLAPKRKAAAALPSGRSSDVKRSKRAPSKTKTASRATGKKQADAEKQKKGVSTKKRVPVVLREVASGRAEVISAVVADKDAAAAAALKAAGKSPSATAVPPTPIGIAAPTARQTCGPATRVSPASTRGGPRPQHINGLSLLPFEPHHRDFIEDALQQLPYRDALRPHPVLGHVWVELSAAEVIFEAPLKPEFATAEPLALPQPELPARLGPDGESLSCSQERRLFHASLFAKECVADEEFCEERRYRPPRCGETGYYFTNEELTAALNSAVLRERYSSNLWFTRSFAAAHEKLRLVPGATPVHATQSARVFIVPDEVVVPKLLMDSHAPPGVAWAPGMNSLSRVVTDNATLRQRLARHHATRSGCKYWVTQSQLEFFPEMALQVGAAGVVAEVFLRELFNQDALEVPGRLALKPSRWFEQFFS